MRHVYVSIVMALNLALIGNTYGQELAEKKVRLSVVDKRLSTTLLELSITYKLAFEYADEDLDGVRVTLQSGRASLKEVMDQLLTGTGLSYTFNEPNIISIKRGEMVTPKEIAKNLVSEPTKTDFTVSGVVKDAQSGESLPYATLSVEGSPLGTNSNVDGWFTLLKVPSDTALLKVSYVGYQSHYYRLAPGQDPVNLEILLKVSGTALTEVVIEAESKEQMMESSQGVSKVALAPAKVAALPSIGAKDVFRSLQLLPGVSGSNESSSALYVRGGTPDQNLVLFDGFTVYHVDHLFGFFSAFNGDAVKDVQLYKGGFEAKYGERLSSVVDITGKDGNTKEFNTGLGLSLLNVEGFVETPFADGKGSILVAGRRSFQSNLYRKLLEFSHVDAETGTEEDTEEEQAGFGRFGRAFATAEPESWFYDVNAKATYRFNDNIISLSFFNSKDHLDNSTDSGNRQFAGGPFGGGGNTDLRFNRSVIDESSWGNTGTSFKWSKRWNDKLYSNALVSYSNYFSDRDRLTNVTIDRDTITETRIDGTIEYNDLKDYSFKWDWEWRMNPDHKIDFGTFGSYLDIKYDYIQNDSISILSRDDQGAIGGVYLQSSSTILGNLIVRPGLRATTYNLTGKFYLEPRIQVQYHAGQNIKLKAATGRYYQFANRVIREDVAQGSRDFWVLSDGKTVPVGYADHYIAGISYEAKNYLFDVEGYYKKLGDITDYSSRFVLNGFGPGASLEYSENFFVGDGVAKGIEFLAQKKSGATTGWISYTLGQVEYQFDAWGEDPFPTSHDVTHEIKLVGLHQIGQWTFGANFIYATGRPYTAPLGAYTVELLDESTTDHFAVSDRNSVRLPDYHRLDLSVNYDIGHFIGGRARIGLSIFNTYGRQNVWYKEYDVVEGVILETDVNLLGFTPSLNFNWTLR